ncbi:MAG: G5 domain-containing protein, partial [Brachybacterium sp.]|nr:G5 domain-containing protein [Brachybacterium sp.]
MKKPPLIVSLAVGALALGGTGTAFAQSNTVTIDHHGETTTVRTFDSTVEQVLENQDIEVSDSDSVSPGLAAPVADDIEITIVEQQSVTLDVDGTAHEVLTSGETVQDALDELDVDLEGAAVSPGPATPLRDLDGNVTVATVKQITFTGQYGTSTYEVTGGTVREAAEANLRDIEDTDEFAPGGDTVITEDMEVTLTRVRTDETTETEEIPAGSRTVEDDSLEVGTSEVREEGTPGERERTIRETTVDGEVTETEVIDEQVTTEPTDRVIAQGTREPEPEPAEESTPAEES